jgi:DNA-directed RNA polymerase subunit RPC12/RpoP
MSNISFDDLKRALREIEVEKQNQQPSQPIEPKESHADHICSCPNCLCDTIEKLNLTSDYVCKDCGMALGSKAMVEKLEMCPNCGKTRFIENTQDMKDQYRKNIAGKSLKR